MFAGLLTKILIGKNYLTDNFQITFNFLLMFKRATSKTWTRTLDPDPGPGPWTLDLDHEKPGINIGLKNMSDFSELCFTKTTRNVSYCLKVGVLTDL